MVLTRSRAMRVLVWSGAVALILAVGVARVYLAVHWTTDVLVGIVIGTLWALGMARAFRLRAAPAVASRDAELAHLAVGRQDCRVRPRTTRSPCTPSPRSGRWRSARRGSSRWSTVEFAKRLSYSHDGLSAGLGSDIPCVAGLVGKIDLRTVEGERTRRSPRGTRCRARPQRR